MKYKAKIGLLPLYLKLYDDYFPDIRIGAEAFHALVAGKLSERGLEVVNVPVCRVKEECDDAVSLFEVEGVDAIVTLHLSYSPSLEVSYALSRTAIPVIVLAATPDYIYDSESSPSEMIYNQGVGGVLDMCNMLHRGGKHFDIVAGHSDNAELYDHVVTSAVAAKLVRAFKSSRVGVVGETFKGMGDFQLGGNKLRELVGIEMIKFDPGKYSDVSDDEVAEEYKRDTAQYITDGVSLADYTEPARAELILRKWIKSKKLSAYTMNFIPEPKNNIFRGVPYSGAGKAMRDGIGYAGDGDALTAALAGTLLAEYPYLSFTELFCPDWRGSSMYLSRAGEQNPRCTQNKAKFVVNRMDYGERLPSLSLCGTYREGEAALVCIAPQDYDRFRLIVCRGSLTGVGETNRHAGRVNGWFMPTRPLEQFIKDWARAGGMHHALLVY
ncbi:MAG: hypothetical protein WCQ72_00815, partial [Eubacteriales bacterium]